ncbi:MAG: sigma-70 family RNA polymerase sigma factor [Bacteroidota bacterium]
MNNTHCPSNPLVRADRHLIHDIHQGGVLRERCTSQLYDTYQGLIYHGCKTYDLSLQESQDVFADSLAYLIYQIDREVFRGEARISTYLHRIFCNRCLTFKRNARVLKRKGMTEELVQTADHTPDPCAIAQTNDKIHQLELACHRIGPHCQQILWDSAYLGFSLKEIAGRIGLSSAASVATLKSRYVRRLRKMVG